MGMYGQLMIMFRSSQFALCCCDGGEREGGGIVKFNAGNVNLIEVPHVMPTAQS